MLFLENIHLFNPGSRIQQTDRYQDYYGNTALCSRVHRAVKRQTWVGARCSRIAESVEQRLRDGRNVTELQNVLTVRRAGDLRQLAQLRSFAVCDAVDDGAVRLEPVGRSQRPATVDRRTVTHQDHYLNTRVAPALLMCVCIRERRYTKIP